MRKTYLTFHTNDTEEGHALTPKGDALLHRLGDALESLGYAVDYEAGVYEYDWLFAARRGQDSFAVVLSLMGEKPPYRWFTWLEGKEFKALEAPLICEEAHPVMQAALEAHPGVTHLRWHETNKTLREA